MSRRCRCCGATPEQVLERAIELLRMLCRFGPALRFATRWRDTIRDGRDFVCWFCQLWAARLDGIVLEDAA